MAMRRVVCAGNVNFIRAWCQRTHPRCHSTATSDVAGQRDVEYPQIVPKLPPGSWSADIPRQQAWQLYREGQLLLDLPDVRERLEMLAGEEERPLHIIEPFQNAGNRLAFKQAITRSHIVKGLPDRYQSQTLEAEEFEVVKAIVIDAILQEQEFQFVHQRSNTNQLLTAQDQSYSASHLINQVLNDLSAYLSIKNEYLLMSQIDRDVRVETFWSCSGFKGRDTPAVGKKNGRLMMQYRGKAQFQIRTEQSLPEFVSMGDPMCTSGEYPKVECSPSAAQQKHLKGRPISVAGHWIGDPCEFNLLSIIIPNKVFYEMERDCQRLGAKGQSIVDANVVTAGMMTSFASCAAQAHNLGFNLYFDLTYPLTTQTIVTNGQWLQSFTYQLNTLHMWQDATANPSNNVMWVGDRLRLYDVIEAGQVKGFNDDALRAILSFLLTRPGERGVNMRPYLTQDQSPLNKKLINFKGEEPIEKPKIGRWQYPRHAIYF